MPRRTPTIVPGPIEFIIAAPGNRASLGSNDINTMTPGSITGRGIDHADDRSRFTPGSGPHTASHLNFWIADGAAHHAVIAEDPTNPAIQPLYNNGYYLTFNDLSDKVARIFLTTDSSWLPNGDVNLSFADTAGFVIQAPTVAEAMAGWAGLGSDPISRCSARL